MYMRISWGRVDPGKWDEYEAAFKEGVAAAGAVPGLRGRVLGRDLDDRDSGYSLSLWDSAEAMEAYETGAAETEILPRIQPFFGGAFTTNRVEVVFEDEFSVSLS
jgi:heme-degrading monooxygenase HmoA